LVQLIVGKREKLQLLGDFRRDVGTLAKGRKLLLEKSPPHRNPVYSNLKNKYQLDTVFSYDS